MLGVWVRWSRATFAHHPVLHTDHVMSANPRPPPRQTRGSLTSVTVRWSFYRNKYNYSSAHRLVLHTDQVIHKPILHCTLSYFLLVYVLSHLLSFSGPHIWNSLPQDLRHSSTLSSFKAKLKTFFSQYFRPN